MTQDKINSVLIGGIMAITGALGTYAAQIATNTDLGQWGPLLGAAISVAANAVRKYLQPNA